MGAFIYQEAMKIQLASDVLAKSSAKIKTLVGKDNEKLQVVCNKLNKLSLEITDTVELLGL